MAIQDKFNRANVIYKITKDIDLKGETLTIPEGCTLDFQGGSFSNGIIIGTDTLVHNGYNIFANVKLEGTYINDVAYAHMFKGLEISEFHESLFTLSKNVLLDDDKTYTAHTSINIPNGARLHGSIFSIGESAIIRLYDNSSIVLSSNTEIDHLTLFSNDVVIPQPNSSNFKGEGIVGNGVSNVYIHECTILGFHKCINIGGSSSNGKITIDNVRLDGINGIELANSWDISRISRVHIIGFVTSNANIFDDTSSTPSNSKVRGGIGFYFHHQNDGTTVDNCFDLTHQIGIKIDDGYNMTFNNCWLDGIWSDDVGYRKCITNKMGIYLTGGCNEIIFNNMTVLCQQIPIKLWLAESVWYRKINFYNSIIRDIYGGIELCYGTLNFSNCEIAATGNIAVNQLFYTINKDKTKLIFAGCTCNGANNIMPTDCNYEIVDKIYSNIGSAQYSYFNPIRSVNNVDNLRNARSGTLIHNEYNDSLIFYGKKGKGALLSTVSNKGTIPLDSSHLRSNNITYFINRDIDLNGESLSIGDNCEIIFMGGKIINGTLNINRCKLPNGIKIEDYITCTIIGNYANGQCLYDSILNKPKWWTGTKWVDATGTEI